VKSQEPTSNVRHWAIRLIVAFALASATACIIGPKQDDPESDITAGADSGVGDGAFSEDPGRVSDTSFPAEDTATTIPDAASSSDTAASDTGAPPTIDGGCGGDAAADGGDAGETGCDSGGGDAVSDG
jgi:hypothetical protein